MRQFLIPLLLSGALWAEPMSLDELWKIRQGQSAPAAASASTSTHYHDAVLSAFASEQALQDPARSQQWQRLTQQVWQSYSGWLADYPQLHEVHGRREPAWIHGESDQAALLTIALINLEKIQSLASRREQISQLAQGIAQLRHPETQSYPFGAHVSFDGARRDSPAFVPTPAGKAPGALVRPERSFQVKALAMASAYLGDKTMLEEAQVEALALWAHLAVSGRWVWGFVPRPTGHSPVLAPAAGFDNFSTLYAYTQQPAFALLAGLSGRHCLAQRASNPAEGQAQAWVRQQLNNSPASQWLGFEDVGSPVSYQMMEAEEGRAVQKAFEAFEVTYPDGESGKMVKVGRDQMFWMRFDIEREDDYFFYMTFLKSALEGGLVSVMMRIDGDKIFQVNLGGASDPYVDMDFVDGPRPLRAGPHSFGIRFAGLLMTQPAILDSVVAWPVIERRHLRHRDGRHLLVLHNVSQKAARTTFPEVPLWPPEKVSCIDGLGQSQALERQSDRRRRKEYIVLPPGGLAWLEWREGQ